MATKTKKKKDQDLPIEDQNRRKKKKPKHQYEEKAEEKAEVRAKHHKRKNKKAENIESEEEMERKEEKKNSLITDTRFASAHSDPRFQRMPRRESKIPIDSRFAQMLTDKRFSTSSAPVDKRGKPRKGKMVNPLLHYYLHEETEVKSKGEEDELPEEEIGGGLEMEVPDEGVSADSESGADGSSSTDEEEDDDDDECSVNSDICRYLMASHEDTPLTENETHRIAVVNMDWDHIKAVDLYVVMSSCLPKGGQIFSVAIYPSEFGLKCMEVEVRRGPSALLFDDNEEHSEDESEVDDEKLRIYELNKLRYYYAVVVCDSSATANHIYKTLDGTELLKTSNVFDLRFIPDTMEFKHPPHDITKEAPTSYKEPDFHTRALQHSKIKLTWEEDEPQRKKILRRKFNPDQLDELNDYLASSGESDDGVENEGESDGGENVDTATLPYGGAKKHMNREKLRALLQFGDGSSSDKDDDKDMEITFNTGLEDLSKHILEKKDEKSETVWETVLRKRREKKAARKNRSNHYSEDDSSDFDVQEAPDRPDDFFIEEPLNKKKLAESRGGESSRKGREGSSEIDKEKEASRAELELLFAEDQEGQDQGPKGYNLKPKKDKRKKGKEVSAVKKLPNIDISNDPRFSSLLINPLFALDPTDPQYKRSASYARQMLGKQRVSAEEEATEEVAMNPSEQDQLSPNGSAPNKENILNPSRVSLENEKHEFSYTVRSLKRNIGNLRKEPKSR